eukprot:15450098-Alexandrium_andersonii.AAC.1
MESARNPIEPGCLRAQLWVNVNNDATSICEGSRGTAQQLLRLPKELRDLRAGLQLVLAHGRAP